jgi:hypothetical protein
MTQPASQDFVPRSQEEIDAIIATRPDYWEHRLFAGALLLEMNALDAKYEDYLLGYAPRLGVAVYEPNFMDFLTMQLDELQVIAGSFVRVFTTEADHQTRAFGPRGVPGDAGRIVHLARRYVAIYEELLLWVERLRGTSVPGKYRELVAILVRFPHQPIEEIRRFVAAYAETVAEIPAQLNGDDSPIVMTHVVSWKIPDPLMAEYNQEFERIRRLGRR